MYNLRMTRMEQLIFQQVAWIKYAGIGSNWGVGNTGERFFFKYFQNIFKAQKIT